MLKDMLGSIPRALAPVDIKYHGVILNVIQRHAGDDAPIWHSRFAKVLREKLPETEPREYKFLRPVAEAVAEVFHWQDFYNKNNEAICFSKEFVENILSAAEDFEPIADIPFPRGFDLEERASDSNIRLEFPPNHTYPAGEFLWQAKRMVASQPKGVAVAGRLLTNNYANIFYVIGRGGVVFAVSVSWWSGSRQWDFRCPTLDDALWDVGNRAFSRN